LDTRVTLVLKVKLVAKGNRVIRGLLVNRVYKGLVEKSVVKGGLVPLVPLVPLASEGKLVLKEIKETQEFKAILVYRVALVAKETRVI
jgi:hypothetical protein